MRMMTTSASVGKCGVAAGAERIVVFAEVGGHLAVVWKSPDEAGIAKRLAMLSP